MEMGATARAIYRWSRSEHELTGRSVLCMCESLSHPTMDQHSQCRFAEGWWVLKRRDETAAGGRSRIGRQRVSGQSAAPRASTRSRRKRSTNSLILTLWAGRNCRPTSRESGEFHLANRSGGRRARYWLDRAATLPKSHTSSLQPLTAASGPRLAVNIRQRHPNIECTFDQTSASGSGHFRCTFQLAFRGTVKCPERFDLRRRTVVRLFYGQLPHCFMRLTR